MFSLLFCGKRSFQVRKLVLDLSQDRLSDGNFLSMLTNALLPLKASYIASWTLKPSVQLSVQLYTMITQENYHVGD